MKKFIITAIIAAINLCAFAQIDPALLSMKNRQITNSTQVVTPNTAQSTPTPTQQAQTASVKKRVPTQHMVTSSIQTDTNGNAKKQSIIDRLNGLENPIKEEWDAVFVREHKEKALALKDGFHIEATMVKRVKNQGLTSPLLTINTNEYQNTGLKEAPAPAPVFDDKPITVQFSQDGKLIPLSSLTTQQKKAIVDTMQVQKPLTVQAIFNNLDNDDDLIDSIFNQTPHIIFRGETFEKVLNEEIISPKYKQERAKRKATPKVKTVFEKETVRTREDFIAKYETDIRKCELDGIPYAIKMAQALVEGSTRDKGLTKMAWQGHNTFGIKCKGGQCHEKGCNHGYYTDDLEGETFKHFNSISECIKYHTEFLKSNDRYNSCFECGLGDIQCWLYRLQKSGYATHKHYDKLLQSTINSYDLTDEPIEYDRAKTGKRLAKKLK